MKQKQKDKQVKILMATFLLAISVIILTGAYKRPFNQEQPEVYNEWVEEREEEKEFKKAVKEQEEEIKIASWYDYELDGIEWSKSHRTAASRDLHRYSMARITNIDNGKSVEVYINDYIEHPERDIDLSSYAFSQIADLKIGLANVKIEQIN